MPCIGKIVKAHGIGGLVKVDSYLDTPDLFDSFEKVSIDKTEYKIEKCSYSNDGFVFLKLENVNNMNDALLLKDKNIYIDKNDMPELDKGRYYISDIIGLNVATDTKIYGKIVNILQYGSADIVEVKAENGGFIRFPWLNALNVIIDIENKIFKVDEKMFLEVALYED